jgi:hypothetical protein
MSPFESMSTEERNRFVQEIQDRSRYAAAFLMLEESIPDHVLDEVRRQFERMTKRDNWRNPVFIRSREL